MSARGVFVLGMHRSGTSVAARLVNLLGVPLLSDDLLPPDDANPKGYWESETLKRLNDELLAGLGRDWTWPPRVTPPWDGAAAQRMSVRAREELGALGDEWVWKDPRNCVTFEFWVRALALDPTVVLVFRDRKSVV